MRSLIARLLVVVSVALLPALAFQAYTESQERHVRQTLVEDEALRLVRLVASEQKRILDGAEQVLDTISATPAVLDDMPEICQHLMANLLPKNPRYNFLAVIGLDGHLLCSPGPIDPSLDLSDRFFFRQALQTGGFVVGEYTVGRVSGQPAIHLAKPFTHRDGKIAGVIAVALSLDWLGQQLAHLSLPPGALASITDRNGVTLARTLDGERFVGTPARPENHFTLEGNEIRVTSLTTLEGLRRIAAYSPPGADPKGLRISVVLDPQRGFPALTEQNRIGLLLIVAGCVLALMLAALLGTQLIRRPVNRLLAAADRWRNGDLTAGTGLRKDSSEFGRLGAAFDAMAAALDARERALRTALESTTDGVIVLDRAWRITYLNAHAKALIARGRDLLGQVVWEAFPSLAGTSFADAYRAAMEQGQPTRVKDWYAPLNGYYEAKIYPSTDGVTIFYGDLTEKHRIETALAGIEARLRLAQEAAGIGVWEYDSAENAIIWSPEQYALYGIEPAAGPQTFEQWLDLVTPEDRPAVLDASTAAQQSGSTLFRLEFRIRRRSDGAVRWLFTLGRLVSDGPGGSFRMVGVSLDVTDRRRVEDDLQRAVALLRAIGTCSPDPIYAKDTEGRFLFTNPAVLAVIGKPAEEVIGHTDAEWHHDPEQAAAVMANDRGIIATGRTERLEEIFDAGTERRVFRSAKAPLRMDDGSVVGVVAISSDITQLKETEAALRRLTDELEARVRAEVAAREVAQSRAAQAERMQALGLLAGGIAHDFNNVLQAVEGAASLIERRPGDAPGARRLARHALDAVDRGASITRRLLAFARRGDLRAEALDVVDLLGGLREILAHTLGAVIEVHVRLGAGLPRLFADKGQLETVLVNLASNARDAMPDGGRLTLAAEAELVTSNDATHPAGLAAGRYVRLTIADTGAGMDAATLARACEPFFTTKEIGAGTGLGLPMAKGFATQSGGALRVESAPGQGTTVTLWLPEAVPGTRKSDSRADAAARFGGNAPPTVRVLLVDDEELVREMLAESLEDLGFGVLAAANGPEVLGLLASGEAVDVLVTDLSMPGMDGLAVIRAAQDRRPGLPAVLLTGYAGDGAALAVGGAVTGAFSLLRKPIRIHELTDRIQSVMAAKATVTR